MPVKTSGKVQPPQPVTELKRVCRSCFAVTKRGDVVEIRQLPCPTPAPKGQVAQVAVLPRARVRKGR